MFALDSTKIQNRVGNVSQRSVSTLLTTTSCPEFWIQVRNNTCLSLTAFKKTILRIVGTAINNGWKRVLFVRVLVRTSSATFTELECTVVRKVTTWFSNWNPFWKKMDCDKHWEEILCCPDNPHNDYVQNTEHMHCFAQKSKQKPPTNWKLKMGITFTLQDWYFWPICIMKNFIHLTFPSFRFYKVELLYPLALFWRKRARRVLFTILLYVLLNSMFPLIFTDLSVSPLPWNANLIVLSKRENLSSWIPLSTSTSYFFSLTTLVTLSKNRFLDLQNLLYHTPYSHYFSGLPRYSIKSKKLHFNTSYIRFNFNTF